eukprot:7321801-Alexandrium_andersonii.AAC.1
MALPTRVSSEAPTTRDGSALPMRPASLRCAARSLAEIVAHSPAAAVVSPSPCQPCCRNH